MQHPMLHQHLVCLPYIALNAQYQLVAQMRRPLLPGVRLPRHDGRLLSAADSTRLGHWEVVSNLSIMVGYARLHGVYLT